MDEQNQAITVNVFIDGIALPMKAKNTDQEQTVREAAKRVNERVNFFRERYKDVPGMSMQKCYAMVMLNSQIEAIDAAKTVNAGPVMDVIDDLMTEIEVLIKK